MGDACSEADSLLESTSDSEPPPPTELDIARVVLLTQCALEGTVTCKDSFATVWQQRAYIAAQRFAPLGKCLLGVYLAAYLFEVPSWCWLNEDQCGDPAVVLRSPLSSTLPLSISRPLQIFCLSCLLGKTSIERHALGTSPCQYYFGIGVALFALLDNMLAMHNSYGLPPKCIYWSPLLRPFVFCGQVRSVRRFIVDALPAMSAKAVLDVLFIEAALMLVWAWFGMLLFSGTTEGNEHFESYGAALLSLFTVFTTTTFPDIMMRAYARNWWAFAFFGVYLLVALYLIFNVLLAALFNSYKTQMHCTHESLKTRASETLQLGFRLLARSMIKGAEAGVDRRIWKAFFKGFSESRGVKYDERRAAAIFSTLAVSFPAISLESWLLIVPELKDTCCLLQPEDTEQQSRSLWGLHLVVDIFTVLSVAITVAHTSDLLRKDVVHSNWCSRALHFMVCELYLTEAVLRVVVLGPGQLLSHRWLVDMLLAVTCSVAEGLVLLCGPSHSVWRTVNSNVLSRVVVLLRAARVERVIWRFPGPRSTLHMILPLVGTFKTAGSAMFFLFYLYGTIGVQVFGGCIRRDLPSLQETEFATAGEVGYWANNFNDFASGVVVMFELMVANNWHLMAEALALAAPGHGWVGWLFCISFYFCLHTVVLNILVTSVVESYERLQEMQNTSADSSRLVEIKSRLSAPPTNSLSMMSSKPTLHTALSLDLDESHGLLF